MDIEEVAEQITDRLFEIDDGSKASGLRLRSQYGQDTMYEWDRNSAKNAILEVLSDQVDLLEVLEDNKWDLHCNTKDVETPWAVYCNYNGGYLSRGKTPAEAILNAIENQKEV